MPDIIGNSIELHGTITDQTRMKATIEIPVGGGSTPTGTKQISITANGTTTENVTDYADAEITTNVPNTYTASDEGKVVSSGALASQTSRSVTANGTYDTTTNNSVSVAVPQPTGTKTISITENGTYTEDVADYADASISVEVQGSGGWTIDDFVTQDGLDGEIQLSATSICDSGLQYRRKITGITAPNLLSVGNYSIGNCTGLASVYMPLLNSVGGNAFNGCIVSTFAFPSLARFTSGSSFCNNTHLTTFDMGGSGTGQLGSSNTFNNDSALTTVIIRNSSVCTLSNINVFNNTPFASGKAGGTLYVPQSLISSYQSATNWSTILGYANNSIQAIEGSQYENYYADGTPIS